MVKDADKTFVYGVSVGGNNFTDRTKESHRLKMTSIPGSARTC